MAGYDDRGALTFTVLGSGTAAPHPTRGPAGFLVGLGRRHFLVDGGSGTLQRCVRAGVDPRTLAGGFYSHRHPDHCGDLVPLLFSMRVPPRRKTPYPIFAGDGFGAFFTALSTAHGRWMIPGEGEVQLTELSLSAPGAVALDGLVVRHAPANHGAGALHLRFEAGGASVVFSGDTGPSPALIELATDADLLVCECAGSDHEPLPGHLTPSAVAEIARVAQPGQVWLTHLTERVDPDAAVAKVAATGVPTRHADDLDAWRAS